MEGGQSRVDSLVVHTQDEVGQPPVKEGGEIRNAVEVGRLSTFLVEQEMNILRCATKAQSRIPSSLSLAMLSTTSFTLSPRF